MPIAQQVAQALQQAAYERRTQDNIAVLAIDLQRQVTASNGCHWYNAVTERRLRACRSTATVQH